MKNRNKEIKIINKKKNYWNTKNPWTGNRKKHNETEKKTMYRCKKITKTTRKGRWEK